MMSERPHIAAFDRPPLPGGPRIVSIGSFDGVHRGHQLLLKQAVERAQELNLKSAIVTFEPLPAMVLRPAHFLGRICTAEVKLKRLQSTGFDDVATVQFDLDLAQLSPEAFLEWLASTTSMKELWVGEAFALGKNRVGDVYRIREAGKSLGFEVIAVPRLSNGDEVVSSSAIRSAIREGEVGTARELLGYPFRIAGEVIHGAHLGRTIGYPTANVVPPVDLVGLADGIYVSCAYLQGETSGRQAMTYIGTRPTVNTGARLIETHIFDFDGDLYGQILAVDFFGRLRADQTFEGVDALVAQLKNDEQASRAYFTQKSSEVFV
jgi:riboflavin kinase / FMN adenylyltransferase